MGCSKVSYDAEMRELVSKMSSSIQSKSLLQYRINQLKSFLEQRKLFPDVTEVKETQLQVIRLAKEIKDTANLLNSIKGGFQDDHFLVLDEVYNRLAKNLQEKELEAAALEEEVAAEAKLYEELQEKLMKLTTPEIHVETLKIPTETTKDRHRPRSFAHL